MSDNRKWRQARKPKILQSKDISGLTKYIESNKCNNIVLMLGAGTLVSQLEKPPPTQGLSLLGVSTSAGIPDFRSPKTGLYSNLARLKLPHPEAVFEIGFFRRNPVPFYTLAQELYPGKFRPTLAHSFIRLLHDKGLLLKCFTQNIDTLERRAGVPGNKIIEAHGSFATQHCIDCSAPYDDDLIKVHIKEKTIPRCDGCRGLVKPDIVFFGESLPDEFIKSIPLLEQADLLIVMGTSLTVHPFARLAELVEENCPRVLVNLERVGDFAQRPDDVLLLGKCDEMVQKLCQQLGWEDELNELWKATADSVEVEEDALDKEEKRKAESAGKHGVKEQSNQDSVEKEVESLTSAIGRSLEISGKQAPSPAGIDKPSKSNNEPAVIPNTKLPADTEVESKPKTTIVGEGKL